MKNWVKHGTAALILLFLTGCANFERDWKHAKLLPPSSLDNPEGPWEGRWLSDVNGHTGSLRCIVSRRNTDEYDFRFKATYWKVFRYSYTVTMPIEKKGQIYSFEGQEDLGWVAGGVYHYNGTIHDTNMNAVYSCKFDRGTFILARPQR